MPIEFSDIKGIILQDRIPQKQTINVEYCAEAFIHHCAECISKKENHVLDTTLFLLQGKAQPHTVQVEISASVQVNGTSAEKIPCNTDLCNFWAFPMLKHELQGLIFKSDGQVTQTPLQMNEKHQKMGLLHAPEVGRKLQKCIPCEGSYLKKETMPNPQNTSDTEQSRWSRSIPNTIHDLILFLFSLLK